MIALAPVLRDSRRLRARLMLAEVLARPGRGPLALRSLGFSPRKPPSGNAAPAPLPAVPSTPPEIPAVSIAPTRVIGDVGQDDQG